MRKEWIDKDEIELLIAFIEAGYTHREIANELDRTRTSISHKAERLNLKSKNKNLKTHEQYVAELAIKNPSIIALERYIDSHTPILHKCLVCENESMCKPYSKLAGHTCRPCVAKNNTGGEIDPDEPAIVYLVDFYEIDIIKPGVTGRTTEIRNNEQCLAYEIIFERHFDTGREAMVLEELWLKNTKHLQVNTGLLKSGNTETFRYNGE